MYNNQVVAIVDDDESVRVATSSLVRSLGWEARPFSSARDFLDSGSAAEVACVISDIQMPGMTGLEMQRALVHASVLVPVIFITAFCTESIRKQALECGARSFLCKPVDGTAVCECLEQITRESAREP
ncbi:response regulator transcription factor [Cupriavidus sp. IDO]|uniref:response regulator transcription factor n=1 Tax=Cupriavidus sp. IDO TaxID=1539142 RepID=UPI00057992BC|nr:response regulator [Cupriavidus sp. IDO]KWR83179.1 response regulator receiver protein [Cupriavidus sp. IDO]